MWSTHTYTHTHTYIHLYTCLYTHIQTHTHLYTHTCNYTHLYILLQLYTEVYIHTLIQTRLYTHTHTHTHTYTYPHMHLYTHTHIQPCLASSYVSIHNKVVKREIIFSALASFFLLKDKWWLIFQGKKSAMCLSEGPSWVHPKWYRLKSSHKCYSQKHLWR